MGAPSADAETVRVQATLHRAEWNRWRAACSLLGRMPSEQLRDLILKFSREVLPTDERIADDAAGPDQRAG